MTRRRLFSIGYEGRDAAAFVEALTEARASVLVDTRLTPLSRKKGLSKTALREACRNAGIEYVHLRPLGNPKDNRASFQNGKVAVGRRNYFAHLNNGSRPAFDELVALAKRRRVAVMCVESDDERCHRKCITDQIVAENPQFEVVNL